MCIRDSYYGLFALQHRGQESCGIAVSDTHGPKGKVTTHKGMGLVNEVFTHDLSLIHILTSHSVTTRMRSYLQISLE